MHRNAGELKFHICPAEQFADLLQSHPHFPVRFVLTRLCCWQGVAQHTAQPLRVVGVEQFELAFEVAQR